MNNQIKPNLISKGETDITEFIQLSDVIKSNQLMSAEKKKIKKMLCNKFMFCILSYLVHHILRLLTPKRIRLNLVQGSSLQVFFLLKIWDPLLTRWSIRDSCIFYNNCNF